MRYFKGGIELIPPLLLEMMTIMLIIIVALFVNQVDLQSDLSAKVIEDNQQYRSHASLAALRSDRRLLNETNEQDLRLDILQDRRIEHGVDQDSGMYLVNWQDNPDDRSLGTRWTSNEPEMEWDISEHERRIFQVEFRPVDVNSKDYWDDGIDKFVPERRNFSEGKVEFSLNDDKVGQMEWSNLNARHNSNYSIGGTEAGPVSFSTPSSFPGWNTGRNWQFRLNMKNKTVSIKPQGEPRIEERFESFDEFDSFSLNLSKTVDADYVRIDVSQALVYNRINETRTADMLEDNFGAYRFEVQDLDDDRATEFSLESEEDASLTYSEVLVARPSKNQHSIVLGVSGSD
jgi:hypothetical protein